MLPSLKSINI